MAGCYGKIPGLGDFLSRNLPASFVEAWDGWLRRVMATCARADDPNWVDRYLSAPIWRFALAPGTVGSVGRAGILVPSVDSIGRCYPLTIAIEIPADVPLIDMPVAWAEGYERAEMIAIGAISRALDHELFVDRAAALPAPIPLQTPAMPILEQWVRPPTAADGAQGPGTRVAGVRVAGARVAGAPESAGASNLASSLALPLLAGSANGLSLWWHLDWEDRPATTVLFGGLPPTEAACGMLLGSWRDWGWAR